MVSSETYRLTTNESESENIMITLLRTPNRISKLRDCATFQVDNDMIDACECIVTFDYMKRITNVRLVVDDVLKINLDIIDANLKLETIVENLLDMMCE